MQQPNRVYLTEVGMRDGFQMESQFVPTDTKIEIGEALIAAGVRQIEITSFVSPKAVPQLADAAEVVARLRGRGASLRALTPNIRGAERAIESGVDGIVAFISASETHNQKNINRSIDESLAVVAQMAAIAHAGKAELHGAIATAFGCPFEGEIKIRNLLKIARCYSHCGVRDVILGDTTGMATPPTVRRLCDALRSELPELRLSLHFHNTRGIGMANVLTGLDLGIDSYESSIGGLGGCPFAIGATGNVCSEDLVYLFKELGIETGIDLEALIVVAKTVESLFGRTLLGQVMKAGPRLPRAAHSQRL
jgi:hydroxymethylglutaryl-CoA lyase